MQKINNLDTKTNKKTTTMYSEDSVEKNLSSGVMLSRKFQVSEDGWASGFQGTVHVHPYDTLSDIERKCKKELINFTVNNNLSAMRIHVESSNYHIHSITVEEILDMPEDGLFYLCCHQGCNE